MTVKVPRKVYRGNRGDVDAGEWGRFQETLTARYPWLTADACDVIMENGRKEYLAAIDGETHGVAVALAMEGDGDPEGAIAHLKRHLEKDPGSERTWYVLGEILCRIGKTEEGYAALARGRSL
ncbi:MAG: tetratricopeptide repeat protein [Thermoplasmatales archaeon]|nr:tetratricopeptide repeat protein [Thermoplasmatales archaeon]